MRKRKKLLFAVLTCLMIFACGAITVFAADGGKEYVPKMYSSFWALVPPIVAIGLALITKEVYCLSELRSEESSGLISILKRQYCIYLKMES